MKQIFAFIFLINTVLFTYSQVFERYYTFDTWTRSNQVIEISQHGYLCIGTCIKTTHDTSTGMLSTKSQGIILKLDYLGDTIQSKLIGNGDTMYTHLFGDNSDDFFRGGISLSDGGLIIAGESQSYGATNFYDYDILLLKINNNLDTLWSTTYSVPDSQITIGYSSINQAHNGNIIVCGSQAHFTNNANQSYLAVFDTLGNVIFHQRLFSHELGTLLDATSTSDGGFMAVGCVYNNSSFTDNTPIIIKTDSLGQLEWETRLPFTGDKHLAMSVVQTPDGHYVYTWENVYYPVGAQYKMWNYHITKIDINGNEIWTKDLGYSFDGHLEVINASNNKLALTGWMTDTLGSGRRCYFVMCDSLGNQLWSRVFGAGYEVTMDILETSDGGFIFCGETYCCNFSPPLGYTSSLWLMKTDSLGLFLDVNENSVEPLKTLLKIYPNPASDFLNIYCLLPNSEQLITNHQIQIFDQSGRQVMTHDINPGMSNFSIDISKLNSGTYYLVLSSGGFNRGIEKFIKIE